MSYSRVHMNMDSVEEEASGCVDQHEYENDVDMVDVSTFEESSDVEMVDAGGFVRSPDQRRQASLQYYVEKAIRMSKRLARAVRHHRSGIQTVHRIFQVLERAMSIDLFATSSSGQSLRKSIKQIEAVMLSLRRHAATDESARRLRTWIKAHHYQLLWLKSKTYRCPLLISKQRARSPGTEQQEKCEHQKYDRQAAKEQEVWTNEETLTHRHRQQQDQRSLTTQRPHHPSSAQANAGIEVSSNIQPDADPIPSDQRPTILKPPKSTEQRDRDGRVKELQNSKCTNMQMRKSKWAPNSIKLIRESTVTAVNKALQKAGIVSTIATMSAINIHNHAVSTAELTQLFSNLVIGDDVSRPESKNNDGHGIPVTAKSGHGLATALKGRQPRLSSRNRTVTTSRPSSNGTRKSALPTPPPACADTESATTTPDDAESASSIPTMGSLTSEFEVSETSSTTTMDVDPPGSLHRSGAFHAPALVSTKVYEQAREQIGITPLRHTSGQLNPSTKPTQNHQSSSKRSNVRTTLLSTNLAEGHQAPVTTSVSAVSVRSTQNKKPTAAIPSPMLPVSIPMLMSRPDSRIKTTVNTTCLEAPSQDQCKPQGASAIVKKAVAPAAPGPIIEPTLSEPASQSAGLTAAAPLRRGIPTPRPASAKAPIQFNIASWAQNSAVIPSAAGSVHISTASAKPVPLLSTSSDGPDSSMSKHFESNTRPCAATTTFIAEVKNDVNMTSMPPSLFPVRNPSSEGESNEISAFTRVPSASTTPSQSAGPIGLSTTTNSPSVMDATFLDPRLQAFDNNSNTIQSSTLLTNGEATDTSAPARMVDVEMDEVKFDNIVTTTSTEARSTTSANVGSILPAINVLNIARPESNNEIKASGIEPVSNPDSNSCQNHNSIEMLQSSMEDVQPSGLAIVPQTHGVSSHERPAPLNNVRNISQDVTHVAFANSSDTLMSDAPQDVSLPVATRGGTNNETLHVSNMSPSSTICSNSTAEIRISNKRKPESLQDSANDNVSSGCTNLKKSRVGDAVEPATAKGVDALESASEICFSPKTWNRSVQYPPILQRKSKPPKAPFKVASIVSHGRDDNIGGPYWKRLRSLRDRFAQRIFWEEDAAEWFVQLINQCKWIDTKLEEYEPRWKVEDEEEDGDAPNTVTTLSELADHEPRTVVDQCFLQIPDSRPDDYSDFQSDLDMLVKFRMGLWEHLLSALLQLDIPLVVLLGGEEQIQRHDWIKILQPEMYIRNLRMIDDLDAQHSNGWELYEEFMDWQEELKGTGLLDFHALLWMVTQGGYFGELSLFLTDWLNDDETREQFEIIIERSGFVRWDDEDGYLAVIPKFSDFVDIKLSAESHGRRQGAKVLFRRCLEWRYPRWYQREWPEDREDEYLDWIDEEEETDREDDNVSSAED